MTNCNTYTVQKGDTLSEIGEWFHVPWQELQRINNIENANLIFPGQVLRLSKNGNVCKTYTVQDGDTLSEIGEQNHVRWQLLAYYNHIANPNVIQIGQAICIPHPQGPSAV
ncbi:LysM domain-containing protein [Saccharopolyspora sp. ASAGF58]|uniref:LysM peptidoglycan-binding domain-containing protein n=1 Tax=Saccharopolyspora TaxID=1835 RepID=UPI001FF0B95F|nr:LysM domain-containing protein [Saccharopolyspora sp. ASAGF58]